MGILSADLSNVVARQPGTAGNDDRVRVGVPVSASRGRCGVGSARWRAVCLAAVILTTTALAYAKAREVPVDLQVKLTAKVAAYDRNMAARVSQHARVLIVRRGNAQSARLAKNVERALKRQHDFAGGKLTVEVHTFENAGVLARLIRDRGVAMAYFAGSFDKEAVHIRRELDGVSVLTVSSELSAVRNGIVLGIGLVSGRPKLFINLPQAKKQRVQIAPRLIKLMEVYR
ncbi:MAG: YfiR family protein [Polyangiaceae bacterium]|nr:YfiR family protein [Polyangiaceae bacterium]